MDPKPLLESQAPRSLTLGRNILNRIPSLVKSIGLPTNETRTLIFTGPETKSVVGYLLRDILLDHDFDVETRITGSSTSSDVLKLAQSLEEEPPNFIIAAGGGRIIDISKYIRERLRLVTQKTVELIAVPTVASHDGIGSPIIFLKNEQGAEEMVGMTNPPAVVIADLDIIMEFEDCIRHFQAGIGDTIAKITALSDWELAARLKGVPFSDFAAGVVKNSMELLQSQLTLFSPENDPYEAARIVIKALLIGGVLVGVSNHYRVSFGSEHLFAMSLDAIEPGKAFHGERVGIGTILMMQLQRNPYWEPLRDALETIGFPVTASSIGLDPESITEALTKAHTMRDNIYTVLGESGLTSNAARKLGESTGVLE